MSASAYLKKTGVVCLVVLMTMAGGPGASAQDRSSSRPDMSSLGFGTLQQLTKRLGGGLGQSAPVLEGAIDPDVYLVGPGDEFSVSIGGLLATQDPAMVAADGSLVLPEVGAVAAAGRTLREVQQAAVAALRPQYRNVPVEVNLLQPRQFYVHVSGAVPAPGRYLATAASRVSEVLELAYAAKAFELEYLQATAMMPPNVEKPPLVIPSATAERPELNEAYAPSLRSLLLTRRDGATELLDLYRYFTLGEIEHNPYLHDGDVLEVPSYHQEFGAVRVSGDVAYPGRYPYRAGDTALDVLLLAGGLEGVDEIEEVRLVRRGKEAAPDLMLFDVAAVRAGQAEAPALQAGDHLNILGTRVSTEAAIYGFVTYPGTYPIEDGQTTLKDLVQMAGGLKPEADPGAAVLQRTGSQRFKRHPSATDLDFFGQVYLQRSQIANEVIVDLEKVLDGSEDVTLYNGDIVRIPRNEGTVTVIGNVPQPGYLDYEAGRNASHYIDLAGGMGPLTKGVLVLENGTGQVRLGSNAPVRPGDTIFVNREDVADTPELAQLALAAKSDERQFRILRTQTIITSITAAVAVLSTLKGFGVF